MKNQNTPCNRISGDKNQLNVDSCSDSGSEADMREGPRRSSRSTKASTTPGSSRLISNEPSVIPDSNAVTPNPKPRAYRCRRREKSRVNTSFTTTFSEPPGEMTPLKYFYMFFP